MIRLYTFEDLIKNTMPNYKNFRGKSLSCRVSDRDYLLLLNVAKKAGLRPKTWDRESYSAGDVLHKVCEFLRSNKLVQDEKSI